MQYVFSVFLICPKYTWQVVNRTAFHHPRDGKPVPYKSSKDCILSKLALAPSKREARALPRRCGNSQFV